MSMHSKLSALCRLLANDRVAFYYPDSLPFGTAWKLKNSGDVLLIRVEWEASPSDAIAFAVRAWVKCPH